MSDKRIGVVGIVIEESDSVLIINKVLHEHSSIIVGRMGLPEINGRDISVISVVVDGTTDQIGSFTGQLGTIKGVNVKSALSKKIY